MAANGQPHDQVNDDDARLGARLFGLTPRAASMAAREHPSEENVDRSERDFRLVQESQSSKAETWVALKAKLKEYNSTLIEMDQLLKLGQRKEIKISVHWNVNSLNYTFNQTTERIEGDTDFVVVGAAGRVARTNIWLEFVNGVVNRVLNWGSQVLGVLGIEVRVNGEIYKTYWESQAQREKHFAITSRFVMALFGGVALIVPTVIMAKVEGLNVSLIVTSIAVLVFSLILAISAADSTGKDVLAATAVYTAVLVVFVGTSVSNGSSGSNASTASNNTTQ